MKKAATISAIKKELTQKEPSELTAICLRLARFKKDNKELLTYLLFEAANETSYVNSVKYEVEEQMTQLNNRNIYFLKKGLRKVLRQLDKYIRFSGNKETEAELRIYFCKLLLKGQIPIRRSKVLRNLYDGQIKKIKSAVGKLHEDLQYDYGVLLEEVELT